jgi:phenylpropionate dioxygenase-like ring-hydroxylating dioxygenase large terminal subunit
VLAEVRQLLSPSIVGSGLGFSPLSQPLSRIQAGLKYIRMLLKNFWYVLAESTFIDKSPRKIRALGQDFVLFRRSSDRRIVALSDVCVHRLASLGGGQVDGDCVRCPYHGWSYGEDGGCTAIPANPPGTPVPKKARVDSYPVEERYGWVWVFLGDLAPEERPPIPMFPEINQSGFRLVRGEFTWKAHFTRVTENAVDIAHTPFVHRNSFGNPEQPVMPAYDVRIEGTELTAEVELEAPPARGFVKWMGTGGKNRVGLGIYLPNLNRIDGTLSNGWRTILLLSNLPIDENTTLTRFIQVRNFMLNPLADGLAKQLSFRILREDQPTVEGLYSAIEPELATELHTKSDVMSIAYRQSLKKYLDLGWQIDHRHVERARSKEGRILLIPSPQRRKTDLEKAWVLDEAPMVKPSET